MQTPRPSRATITPLGDSAVLVRFGTSIDPAVHRRALALAERLERHPFPGLVETVPAYASVTVYYNPIDVPLSAAAPTPYDAVCARLNAMLDEQDDGEEEAPRTVEIPVCYGGEFGPDLTDVAAMSGLSPEAVVALHAGTLYRVYLIGFAPGFPYLGTVPESIRAPRRATPRAAVPAGSVGIAGAQTGIYPFETPGGWQIIGRTPLKLFSPDRDPPSLLRVGDRVRFRPITPEEYAAWEREQETDGNPNSDQAFGQRESRAKDCEGNGPVVAGEDAGP